MNRIEYDIPNWEPLEKYLAAHAPAAHPSDYMWMHREVDPASGVSIEFYKHIDTREYLEIIDPDYTARTEASFSPGDKVVGEGIGVEGLRATVVAIAESGRLILLDEYGSTITAMPDHFRLDR